MVDLATCPLPTHSAEKWLRKWSKSHPEVNKNTLDIIKERIDIIVERDGITAHSPFGLIVVLDSIIKKYNTILYEEDGVIMEIELFDNNENNETKLFGLGNSKFFLDYLIENYPELLI